LGWSRALTGVVADPAENAGERVIPSHQVQGFLEFSLRDERDVAVGPYVHGTGSPARRYGARHPLNSPSSLLRGKRVKAHTRFINIRIVENSFARYR